MAAPSCHFPMNRRISFRCFLCFALCSDAHPLSRISLNRHLHIKVCSNYQVLPGSAALFPLCQHRRDRQQKNIAIPIIHSHHEHTDGVACNKTTKSSTSVARGSVWCLTVYDVTFCGMQMAVSPVPSAVMFLRCAAVSSSPTFVETRCRFPKQLSPSTQAAAKCSSVALRFCMLAVAVCRYTSSVGVEPGPVIAMPFAWTWPRVLPCLLIQPSVL